MVLVVNAGLNKVGLEAPLLKLMNNFLGSVPYSNNLKPIVEKDEEKKLLLKRSNIVMLIMENRIWMNMKTMMTLARSKKKMTMIPKNFQLILVLIYFTFRICCQKYHRLCCMATGLEEMFQFNSRCA
ncbi:hypothetical protein VP01_1826g3 [Puccinia sorghi]|uniref:Uncharacterized protein n=1 Tax=Puccinia sorghi TaxID=27349 RepID=A0A0L6VEI4_9BASI|nr:hypothetical protein VP01_1826g3 [Puccinia sorghi]